MKSELGTVCIPEDFSLLRSTPGSNKLKLQFNCNFPIITRIDVHTHLEAIKLGEIAVLAP
jgi:hypothetical protein